MITKQQAEARVSFLENLLKGIYREKVQTQENGEVKVKLSPSELLELIKAEKELIELRRYVGIYLEDESVLTDTKQKL